MDEAAKRGVAWDTMIDQYASNVSIVRLNLESPWRDIASSVEDNFAYWSTSQFPVLDDNMNNFSGNDTFKKIRLFFVEKGVIEKGRQIFLF